MMASLMRATVYRKIVLGFLIVVGLGTAALVIT